MDRASLFLEPLDEARQRGESAQSLTWARQALASLSTEDLPWRSVSLNVVGIEELLSGQLDAGRKAILESHALSEAVGNPYGTRATTNMLAGLVPQGIIIHEIISIDDDGSSFRPLN